MILDVGPLLRGETESIKIDYMLTPEKLDGVTFNGDAHVLGTLTDNAGYMRLTLKAELSYSGECARCLAPVDGVFSLDFERTVAIEGTVAEDRLEELMLGFPMRLLCSDDCEGLCPKCGKPKRDGDCGCVLREIDPRLAVLQHYFDDKDKD